MTIQIDRTDGLSSATAIKGPVRAATTANISLTGLQTIDGVVLAAEDRVLVKDQTTASENGIWIADTGSWRRAKDFSNNRDVRKGTRVWVTDGTIRAETDFLVTAENPIIIGTTNVTFAAATAPIGDGAVGTTQLADEAVTEPKLGDGSVSTRALADEAVTLAKIDDAAKADFRLVDPNGPRLPWKYHGATSMQVTGVHSLAMGGFRIDGRYTVDRAPVFDAPAFTSENRHILSLGNGTSTAGDLFAEAWHVKSNWYALMAAADDGDTTFDFGFMPWFRVGSIAGNVITLNQGGENQRSVAGKTYQLATNELVGCQVWVRTETLDSRANSFSNRLAEVTANTATTITLDDVGDMAVYDYFLVSPPGYDHFVYLCTGYMDTAELRNIADTGTIVGSRGSANTQANISGNIATSVAVPVDGHISPAATAAVFSHTDTHSTSSGGDSVIRYGMDDGNHDTHEFYYHKDGSASQAFTFQFPPVPFSFFPKLYLYSGGSLNGATNTRTMNMRGWLEP